MPNVQCWLWYASTAYGKITFIYQKKTLVCHLLLTNSHRRFPPPVKPNLHPWLINHRGDVFQPEHYMNNYTEGPLNVFPTTKWLTMELGRECRWGWPLKINVMTNEKCKTAQWVIATKLGDKSVFYFIHIQTSPGQPAVSILIIICL